MLLLECFVGAVLLVCLCVCCWLHVVVVVMVFSKIFGAGVHSTFLVDDGAAAAVIVIGLTCKYAIHSSTRIPTIIKVLACIGLCYFHVHQLPAIVVLLLIQQIRLCTVILCRLFTFCIVL